MNATLPTTSRIISSGINVKSAQPMRPRRAMGSRPHPKLIVSAAPPHATASSKAPKTFMDELRGYAMRLHTRGQAKEGQAAAPKEQKPWIPTKEGYLRFLIESKAVYEAFEGIVANGADPMYREFADTGLERSAALEKDIAYMAATWGLKVDPPAPGGPGHAYAGFLRNLSATSPPAFLCHYYNFYFAHTAGGRMIGAQVSKVALDGWMGDFYKWDGEVSELVNAVRGRINSATQGWSRADKDSCLRETARTFSYSGKLLKELVGKQ